MLYEFELESIGLSDQADEVPPSCLVMYEEVLEAGLRFPLSHFVLKVLHLYGILLCALTPNSIRHIIGFLVLCFLTNIQPTLSLFQAFFTVQIHP